MNRTMLDLVGSCALMLASLAPAVALACPDEPKRPGVQTACPDDPKKPSVDACPGDDTKKPSVG
jgi:hypothetical protein